MLKYYFKSYNIGHGVSLLFIYQDVFLEYCVYLSIFNVEIVEYKNISFTVWDVGGQNKNTTSHVSGRIPTYDLLNEIEMLPRCIHVGLKIPYGYQAFLIICFGRLALVFSIHQ
ncbi:hypothetical protein IC582_016173 [Cucumis melo]